MASNAPQIDQIDMMNYLTDSDLIHIFLENSNILGLRPVLLSALKARPDGELLMLRYLVRKLINENVRLRQPSANGQVTQQPKVPGVSASRDQTSISSSTVPVQQTTPGIKMTISTKLQQVSQTPSVPASSTTASAQQPIKRQVQSGNSNKQQQNGDTHLRPEQQPMRQTDAEKDQQAASKKKRKGRTNRSMSQEDQLLVELQGDSSADNSGDEQSAGGKRRKEQNGH